MGKLSQTSWSIAEERWRELWRQPRKRWLLGVPVGGFLLFFIGILFWAGFNTFVSVTNSEAFCATACHSMREFVTPEWRESSHYSNRTGVRATCADCHVPEPFVAKMVAKVIATKDVYHEIIGTIRTRDQFEVLRMNYKQRVWNKMTRTDSRECRNCHSVTAMDFDRQLQFEHAPILEYWTCIDCHKGIAHELPDELLDELLESGHPSDHFGPPQ